MCSRRPCRMPCTRRRRRCRLLLFAVFAASAFSALLIPANSLSSTASASSSSCRIKICHNKDCVKRGGGEPLLNTFRDLLPAGDDDDDVVDDGLAEGGAGAGASRVSVERSGCLSQCGRGPNVSVVNIGRGEERMYFGVEDPTTASAVLDVATGEEYPINLLVAATSIFQAEHATTSPAERESLLTSAISSLTDDGDPALLNSAARARALLLRADARLDASPVPDVEGAVADAELAVQLAPTERRAWRALASAREAGGDLAGAIDAVGEWSRADPSFSRKAGREIERLRSLL